MTDPRSLDEARQERRLRRALAGLDDPSGPMMGPEIRRRASRSSSPGWRVAAVAAGLLIFLGLAWAPKRPLVQRGVSSDPAVVLGILLEGPEGPARRPTDPRVPADHAILFDVHVRDRSYVCIEEEQRPGSWVRVLPPVGQGWRMEPGEEMARLGGVVQAFRTDLGPGPRRYRALIDAEDPACGSPAAVSTLEVRWMP